MSIAEAPRPIEQAVPLKDCLIAEGMEILPPFSNALPQIDSDYILHLIGPNKFDSALSWVEHIANYPTTEAIYDPQHNEHEQLTKWQTDMEQIYGDEINKALGPTNPFRRQAMTTVNISVRMLAKFIDLRVQNDADADVATNLHTISDNIYRRVNGIDPFSKEEIGIPYESLTDREEKIAVKDFVAEQCVAALRLFEKPQETTVFDASLAQIPQRTH